MAPQRFARPGSSARSGPIRRPPPLLVLAAAGLVGVLGIGAVLIVTRGGPAPDSGRSEAAGAAPDKAAPDKDERPIQSPSESAQPLPVAAVPVGSAPRISAPAPPPAKSVREAIAETGEIPEGTRSEDLPIWARPPKVTAQPFPEGGRIDPPLPPVKIPPEMLVPAPAPGAAP